MRPSSTPDSSLESKCASAAPYAYIDVYIEPDMPRGSAPPPGETRHQWIERLPNTSRYLCRIRYFGNEDRWSFAWYTYAHEKYEPSFLITGEDQGTPEEAFETVSPLLLKKSRVKLPRTLLQTGRSHCCQGQDYASNPAKLWVK
jgi:hypothetical protein